MGRDSDSDSDYRRRHRRHRSRSRSSSGSSHKRRDKGHRKRRRRSGSRDPRDSKYDRRSVQSSRSRDSRPSSRRHSPSRSRDGRRRSKSRSRDRGHHSRKSYRRRSRSRSISDDRRSRSRSYERVRNRRSSSRSSSSSGHQRNSSKSAVAILASNLQKTASAVEEAVAALRKKVENAEKVGSESSAIEAAERQRRIDEIESNSFVAASFRSSSSSSKKNSGRKAIVSDTQRSLYEEMRLEKSHLDAIFGKPSASGGPIGVGGGPGGTKISDNGPGSDLIDLLLKKGDIFSQAMNKNMDESWRKWRRKLFQLRRRAEAVS